MSNEKGPTPPPNAFAYTRKLQMPEEQYLLIHVDHVSGKRVQTRVRIDF